ncbi:MAG: SPFH domain-containing protein [Phycisphaerales bacterium]
MTSGFFFLGIIIAVSMLAFAVRVEPRAGKIGLAVGALLVLIAGVLLGSVQYVGSDQVGIIKKNALGAKLADGKVIATEGEMGPQAGVLPPGWHLWYWPVIYEVETRPLIDVPTGKIGLVEARDGQPLDPGQLFAPEVEASKFKKMLDNPGYFLTTGDSSTAGNGRKGPQSNVLTPGTYRLNTDLFKVEMVDETEVPSAAVAVLKSNFGEAPTIEIPAGEGDQAIILANPGEKGVQAEPLPPGKYPVNTKAYTVVRISTKETIVRFTAAAGRSGQGSEQREINVRTSDGFTFPVDVRIEYKIEPQNAPIVVAKLGTDGEPLLNKLNSAVRAIFRNNAENVKALDYVNQRSQQESQSLAMIATEMARVGVTVSGVRIGDVGNEETLGNLLTTQRDREIAVQEQITFQEQQKAAEQKKELSKTEQEAVEEKRLATAAYEVQIAQENQRKRIIEAEAEAQAIEIEALAQATAYQQIALQIGKSNAALIEVLRIIGEMGIQITPKVMVNGSGSGSSADDTTIALIGTMLDQMVADEDE